MVNLSLQNTQLLPRGRMSAARYAGG